MSLKEKISEVLFSGIEHNFYELIKNEENIRLNNKVVTKISLVKNYCPAEEYHQRYLEKK